MSQKEKQLLYARMQVAQRLQELAEELQDDELRVLAEAVSSDGPDLGGEIWDGIIEVLAATKDVKPKRSWQ